MIAFKFKRQPAAFIRRGSNWADFEQMMIRQNGDVPSPLLRDSGNMITFTGELDNAGARITHHQGWISKKPL